MSHGILLGTTEDVDHDHLSQSQVINTPLSPECEEEETNAHFSDHSQPPSFQSILSGTSLSPYSRNDFSKFLKKIYCMENLDFLLNSNQYLLRCSELSGRHFVNEYASEDGIDNLDTERHYESSDEDEDYYEDHELQQLWYFIYTNYISSESLKEVNLPHELREELNKSFENDVLPSFKLIEKTMNYIKDLLRDSYCQFIHYVQKSQLFCNTTFANDCESYSVLPTPNSECNDSCYSTTSATPAPTSTVPTRTFNFTMIQQPTVTSKYHSRRFSECCSPLFVSSTTNNKSTQQVQQLNAQTTSNSRSCSPLSSSASITKTFRPASADFSILEVPRSCDDSPVSTCGSNSAHSTANTTPCCNSLDNVTTSTTTASCTLSIKKNRHPSSSSEFSNSSNGSKKSKSKSKSTISEASKRIAGKLKWRRLSASPTEWF